MKQTLFIVVAAAATSVIVSAATVMAIAVWHPFAITLAPLTQAPQQSNAPSPISQESASSVVSIVEAASPAVVSVVATRDVPIVERFFESPFPDDPLFEQFFGPFFSVPRERQQGTERRQVAAGSGFIVRKDGLVVTNRHVVDIQDAEFTVFFASGETATANVVAVDSLEDIALLQIQEKKEFPYLELGDSDVLKVGETVIAIGNALGEFQNTVSVGVISGLNRRIVAGGGGQSEVLEGVIQTDAAINQGNSGGPLLNLLGKVVGVNTAIAAGSENIGFAIPINKATESLQSFEQSGKITHAFLGVRYVPVTNEIKEARKLSVDYGALVVGSQDGKEPGVLPDSPAAKAGIHEGDVILEFNGERIDERHSLAEFVRSKKVGETVTVKVLSAGEEREVQVTLGEAP
ncbi:MAG: hypothetical protein A2806_03760 [Candidatus Terrybacteria bacterium RIFCSPHIGHO2_01_FULL_48_17]|uniref:PDZ domain-containing protein n=1 Tax=Candidatus Terrybacteria bacterium RIFCSPHIGHO2_01_FULL_48_17 TaxID=1802362 RepID=A0A1G2PJW4_9BACT|nr:MAG: hypothetical protein A2806_03760 [Candidatus Terrybacteria bacterium RIFCSPHIGHO2_01_FULL_48_17]OHA53917.1 MAG: hypothetical protein A3A30_03820 [Candidatus Terrybacteria bacterium RIFCSPLOWO2_01_FULL_48_14]